jgi:dTDP-4-amino-4,6-dideoxygalactose transaminase
VSDSATTFLPFAKPCLDQAAIDEVVESLQSGWMTTGPKVKKFETMLQDYCQAPHALALNSGTAGLHCALLAMGIKAGDEVITTPMTFAATANTIAMLGAKPVFVDIDRDTRNINLELIEPAITEKTKAIMPVHFAGLPVDCDKLYAIAKKHHLRVIEDGAHAIGAEYKGKRLGSFGDVQMFSFHPNKNMTTGEGGAIIARDQALAEQIARLRFHGIDREAWNRFGKSGSQHYAVVAPGFKYNMLDMQAALGIHQLPKLDEFIKARTKWVQRYIETLKGWSEFELPVKPDYEHLHAWHLFQPVLSDASKLDRDAFMQAMKEQNIGTGYHYQALHAFPYYQEAFAYRWGQFPEAEYVSDRIVSLPLFPQMQEQEFTRVVDAMNKVFKK